MNVAPGYFQRKRKEKELKQTPSCLILRLLVVFTRQLEILVTTLNVANATLLVHYWVVISGNDIPFS